MSIIARYSSKYRFRMSQIGFFSICFILLLLLFRESECNKAPVKSFYQVVEAARESNTKKKKFTKFDNKVIGDIKREVEPSVENKGTFYNNPEIIKEYNVKNNTFVKLWLSDIELRYNGLFTFGGDVSSVKDQKSPEDRGQEEFEINKIIEENRLLDKLNLLRQHDTEITGSGDLSPFDEVTRKKILASGIKIVCQKSDIQQNSESSKKVTSSVSIPDDLDVEDETIILITPNQQIAALEILAGRKLIHTIQLNIESDETVAESKNLIESSVGLEYEEKNFLECVEIKKNLIQKIGKLKLENANLSLRAQKLRNKDRKTKEYRNILENIERNKESLHNQNIELLKIERRIQQLSVEDRMEDSNQLKVKHQVPQESEATLQKKERRKVIIAAILKEAKRRKLINEKNKESGQLIQGNEHVEENNIEKKGVETEEGIEPKKELQDSETKEIRQIAKMLIWLQENDPKTSASVETRMERGASAIKSLSKLYILDKEHFTKVAEKIKNNFEKKVYENNRQKNSNLDPKGKLIKTSRKNEQ
ncbi:coiled coil [Cryptosporidium sp. chipmunk genotype I]|uniref:coiled coil n=1 Tax=Cryptosporidium sp. chipmunk genotype I TaxID=1280935 RepID=UPI00351A4870|nr:coiled coil [Cryptosporidium sp. chipmunk genotype I]